MKKLSKITENLWADLQDRSSGEVERKEDIMRPFGRGELIECIKQQYEKQGKGENLDLTMIVVSDVEDMRYLFECLFSSLNSWDNSKTIKHIDMSNWDVSHVKYMDSMFYGCASIESLEVSDWDVSSVIHMSSMFQNCVNLESIDVSKWKMSSATNLYAMFFRCKKLKTLDVANWDVSHVEVMSEMFSNCEELESLDISNWKPKKLKSAGWMFYNCYKLQPVDVSKWSKSQQDKIPARYRKITENLWADLQDRSSGEVIRKEDIITSREELNEIIRSAYEEQGQGDTLTLDFTGKKIMVDDLSRLFYNYRDLKHIFGLETWDVSNVTDMAQMFCDCRNLIKLDIGGWNTGKVKDMNWMFGSCYNLTKLDIENWDVRNAEDMHYMFYACHNLKELDLERWNIDANLNINNMFLECPVQYIKKGNKLVRQ